MAATYIGSGYFHHSTFAGILAGLFGFITMSFGLLYKRMGEKLKQV